MPAATLDVEIEPSLRPVYADRDRLMQVFINLLSNAAKFADPERGRVRVVGRDDDGGYLVEVSDNGEGVGPQDQQIIFEKFAKARDRNTGRPSGSGLGLTISRHIVEHHGGRIWVRSPPGEGATFCVFLPAQHGVARRTGDGARIRPREIAMAAPAPALAGVRACVFDAYGTLFDFASAADSCRDEARSGRGPADRAMARQAARLHVASRRAGPPRRFLAGDRRRARLLAGNASASTSRRCASG